jgi:hypothetical protein
MTTTILETSMRALILAVGLWIGTPSAWASDNRLCGPLGLIEAMLAEEFGEKPAAHQITESGYILTAYVDEADGSWTIVAHDGRGGCVIQGGDKDTLPESLLLFVNPQV